jgi:hypothetical protein
MHNITCYAHSANLCGALFDCPLAKVFIAKWSYMMSQSIKAKAVWKSLVGKKAKRKAMVRWGAEVDVVIQVSLLFEDVKAVINHATEFADESRASLKTFLVPPTGLDAPLAADGTPNVEQSLALEFAIIMDCGHPIYWFVYTFEGM